MVYSAHTSKKSTSPMTFGRITTLSPRKGMIKLIPMKVPIKIFYDAYLQALRASSEGNLPAYIVFNKDDKYVSFNFEHQI